MEKKVDSVKMMREIRDRLSSEFAVLTLEEQKRVMQERLAKSRRHEEPKKQVVRPR